MVGDFINNALIQQPILKYTNNQRKLLIDQFFFVYMFVSLYFFKD